VIETLQWDCRFASKDQALAQQDRLSRFLKGPGLRVVAEQFERISPSTEVWRIERLEVDLGRLVANASFEEWSAQLQEQLWTSLQRLRRESTAGSAWRLLTHEGHVADAESPAANTTLLSPSQRDLDVFMHYLQQGHLPWSVNLAAARDLADWLTRMALHHGLRLWQRLQQAQPSAQVLQRLCHISPHTGLQALIAVRHPDLADSLTLLDRELLAPLHASGRISAYQLRQLQQCYRVAGLHALWGLNGSTLSSARQQALQQALLQAHRDWLAPSWSPAWRSSLARAAHQPPGGAHGGELASVLLRTLLGEPTDAEIGPTMAELGAALPPQVRADLARLQAALDGSRPMDHFNLGELLDRLQTLQGPAQVRLGQALRMLAANNAQRLAWTRRLGAAQVWQLIQLMRLASPGPVAVASGSPGAPNPAQALNAAAPLVSDPGQRQAAWLASSSWTESLRQFALRMTSAAAGASRPSLSHLQSQLVGHSLRYLAQHGRLPQDHVAWQALWQQAWGALYGETPQAQPAPQPAWDNAVHLLTVADPVAPNARQIGRIGLHRLRDARSRWQLVSTATQATLLECLGSCVGCTPARLSWFQEALLATAQNALAFPVPSTANPSWARVLLWSFSLGLLSADLGGQWPAQDAGAVAAAREATKGQAARKRIEHEVQTHWTALLGVIRHTLPTWWRQWSMQQATRQKSVRRRDASLPTHPRCSAHTPADLPADLHAALQERSARYLATQAWSGESRGGAAKQIEAARNALLRLWPRWARDWLAADQLAHDGRSHAGATASSPADPTMSSMDELLSRPVASLQSAERLQLAELMQTEAGCARWLATHDEAQRWAWLRARFGGGVGMLQQCSAHLLAALRLTCPQMTAQQAHALHWQHLSQHLFVDGLQADPGLLARRYTMRLCQRDLDLAGAASHSWQRWLHRMREALHLSQAGAPRPHTEEPASTSVPSTQTKPVLQASQALSAMQEALLAPPLAGEQWEATLSAAQRAAPLACLAAAGGMPAASGHATPQAPLLQPVTGKDPIYTPTAGLVLLGGYVQRVFSMLRLTEHSKFVDEAAQARAVHCLEYLAWGANESAEPDWVLSKMLCGVPMAQPLPPSEGLDAQTRELLDSLLRAVIEHWKTIGNTSVVGLRQSFLQRAGRLTRKASDLDDQWQLTVEPRAFDMLLDRLPWGYSTIKLPWMAGALHVDWR